MESTSKKPNDAFGGQGNDVYDDDDDDDDIATLLNRARSKYEGKPATASTTRVKPTGSADRSVTASHDCNAHRKDQSTTGDADHKVNDTDACDALSSSSSSCSSTPAATSKSLPAERRRQRSSLQSNNRTGSKRRKNVGSLLLSSNHLSSHHGSYPTETRTMTVAATTVGTTTPVTALLRTGCWEEDDEDEEGGYYPVSGTMAATEIYSKNVGENDITAANNFTLPSADEKGKGNTTLYIDDDSDSSSKNEGVRSNNPEEVASGTKGKFRLSDIVLPSTDSTQNSAMDAKTRDVLQRAAMAQYHLYVANQDRLNRIEEDAIRQSELLRRHQQESQKLQQKQDEELRLLHKIEQPATQPPGAQGSTEWKIVILPVWENPSFTRESSSVSLPDQVQIPIHPDQTIQQIMQTFMNQVPLDAKIYTVALKFKGKYLESRKMLSKYNIRNLDCLEAIVYASFRIKGKSNTSAGSATNLGRSIPIRLRDCQGVDGTSTVEFSIRVRESLQVLVDKYRAAKAIPVDRNIQLYFDGEKLNLKQSPQDFDMEDDDLIDVRIP